MRLATDLPLAALLACACAAPAAAQSAAQSTAPSAPADAPRTGCYRFAFDPWEPTLDAARRDLARYGVDWRVPAPRTDGTMWDADGDSLALLFPAWWPNGVAVRFDPGARGDTLHGEATAFVPDGRALAPRTTIRAVRGRCAGAAPR